MALQVTPDKLRDEIRAAAQIRDKYLNKVDSLVSRLCGRYYRSDNIADRAVALNAAYEFLSVMLPSVVYDSPRCKINANGGDRTDAYGTTSFRQRAKAIQAALNQWSINDDLGAVLSDGAVDFFFAYSVYLVTMANQPGWQGYDAIPQKPLLLQLEPEHFIMDASAKDADPMRLNGPRLMGHMWKSDREDLMSDPTFDAEQVLLLGQDEDLDKYDAERDRGIDVPSRDEIVCWDIWVPERDERFELDYAGDVDPRDPAYNGTIYTVGARCTGDGMSKNTYYLRDPAPAFCGPWGPYVVSGYMKVRRSPYPLSPLVATAEQAEEVNAHYVAMAEDAKNHKRFGVYRNDNQADGNRVKSVKHGTMLGLDDTESVKEIEIGGVMPGHMDYSGFARERLYRSLGMSQSVAGEAQGDTTATAESIAQSGFQIRVAGIKKKYREGVSKVFRAAQWYAFYSDAFRMSLGDEGAKIGLSEYRGGLLPGMEDFNFFDMALAIEPYSLEHTDQAMLQKRMGDMWDKLVKVAPVMAQTPWIRWSEPLKNFFEVMNIEDADEWIDENVLQLSQLAMNPALAMAQAQAAVPAPGMAPAPGAEPAPMMDGGQQQGDAMPMMQEAAADQAAAMAM